MHEELSRSIARVHRAACEAMAGSLRRRAEAALLNKQNCVML